MATLTVTSDNTTVVLGDGDTVKVEIPGGGDVRIEADPTDDVDKIKIDFKGDDHSDKVTIDLSTFSEDDLHIDIKNYDPSDIIALEGVVTTWVDPDDSDEYSFTYIGSDGETYTGFVHAKDQGEKDFTDPNEPIEIVCFGDGTLIATPNGECAIETLVEGDLVLTQDHGPQPIRWIGRRHLTKYDLQANPDLAPIRVTTGALGTGVPSRDLILSPQHRVLLTGWQAELLFGEVEVLVPIKALVNDLSITQVTPDTGVTYHHILLQNHEVLWASGAAAESLFPGPVALDAMTSAGFREATKLFTDVGRSAQKDCHLARVALKPYEACVLAGLAA